MKHFILLVCAVLAVWLGCINPTRAQGTTCATATPFCSNLLNPFPAGTNQPPAPPGNNYDCLFTFPNPAWYTLTIGVPGNIDFTLINSNNVDIDFIVWGPFSSVAAAMAGCGNLGNGGAGGSVIDCSYSGSAIEQVEIPNAQTGQVYILLITNFSNQPTNITSTNNIGTGTIVCDCNVNNTFSELPAPFNNGIMLDTSGFEATFVTCGPDPLTGTAASLGFMLSVGGYNSSDSLTLYTPTTTVNQVFPNNAIFVSPASTPPLDDSIDVLITVTPNATHQGPQQFVISILNSGANACVQNFPITVIVPSITALTSDTVICSLTADTITLFGQTYIPSSFAITSTETYAWTQIAGPPLTFSSTTAKNPQVFIPNNLPFGTILDFVVDYNVTISPTGPTICGGRDTVRVRVGGGVLTTGPGDTICVGESALLWANYETFMQGGTGSCGASNLNCASAVNTVSVGTSAATTNLSGQTPFTGFWEDQRMQVLFRAAELQAAGLQAGLINSLALNVTQKASTQPYNGFTIKMGCTNLTTLAAGAFTAVPTTVFTGNHSTVLGWNTFNLQTRYEWDGVSNLLVEFCFNNTSWTNNDGVQVTPTAYNSCKWDFGDGWVGCNMTGTQSITGVGTNRPNVRFGNCQLAPPITYSWLGQAGLPTTDSITVSPNVTTNYIVVATDGICTLRDTIPVLVQSALPAPGIYCDSVGLDFIGFGWDVMPGATAYEYSLDNGVTWIMTNDPFVVLNGLAQGQNVTILVRALIGLGSCGVGAFGTQSCQTDVCAFQFNLTTFNNTACNNEPDNGYIVVNISSGNPPFTFDLNGSQVTVTGLTDTIFSGLDGLTGTIMGTENGTGCGANANFVVQDQSVQVDVSAVQTQNIPCSGDPIAEVQATATGSPGAVYLWSTGDQTAAVGNLAAGTYTVTASIGNCTDTATIVVTAPLNPNLNAFIGLSGVDSTGIFLGETIEINSGISQNGVSYVWTVNPAAPIANANASSTSTTPDAPGFYVYTITATADSCVTVAEVWLTVENIGFLGMPSAFTPNGDGQNDRFRPVELVGAQVAVFKVFNRWGQLVYDDPTYADGGWDGTYKGQLQARDVYMFVIEYQYPGDAEPTVMRGEVTLLR